MGKKVVYDTNIFISALGWNAKPEQCLELVFQDRVDGYLSPAIVDEIRRVMGYPRCPQFHGSPVSRSISLSPFSEGQISASTQSPQSGLRAEQTARP